MSLLIATCYNVTGWKTHFNIPPSWHASTLSCQPCVIWPVSVPRRLYLRHFTPVQQLSHLTKLSPGVRLCFLYCLCFLFFFTSRETAGHKPPNLELRTNEEKLHITFKCVKCIVALSLKTNYATYIAWWIAIISYLLTWSVYRKWKNHRR